MDSEIAAPSVPLRSHDQLSSGPMTLHVRYWNCCTSVALSGVIATCVATCSLKLLSGRVSVFEILSFQSLVALPFLLLETYRQTGTILGPKDRYLIVSVRGILAAIDFICCAVGITLVPLSTAGLLMNMHPAFIAALLWLLGKERLRWKTWLGISGTIVGPAFILQPSFIFGGESRLDTACVLGLVLFVFGVLCRSIGCLLIPEIGDGVPSTAMTGSVAIYVFILSVPFLFTHYPKPFYYRLSLSDALLCCLCSMEFVNQLLVVRSFQIGPPLKAAVLSLVRIVFMCLLGLIAFEETFSLFHAIGVGILLSSFLLIVLKQQQQTDSCDQDENPCVKTSDKQLLEPLLSLSYDESAV